MTYVFKTLALAAIAGVSLFAGAAARAADTAVTCYMPQIEVNTGQYNTQPRMTLHCLGGSSASGISYFAVEVSQNPVVAQMVQQVYQSFLSVNKKASVQLASNLSDTSGDAWGCSSNNCRILDYAIGL